MLARVVDPDTSRPLSALMRSPHHLHGVFDVTPLSSVLSVALALAILGHLGCLGDGLETVPLDHLPRDHVNLRLGHHVALPMSTRPRKPQGPAIAGSAAACSKPSSRGLVPLCPRLISRAADQMIQGRRCRSACHQFHLFPPHFFALLRLWMERTRMKKTTAIAALALL